MFRNIVITIYRNNEKGSEARRFERNPHASCTHAFCFYGGLAQLARALAWHARGHRFDPDILHREEWKN